MFCLARVDFEMNVFIFNRSGELRGHGVVSEPIDTQKDFDVYDPKTGDTISKEKALVSSPDGKRGFEIRVEVPILNSE